MSRLLFILAWLALGAGCVAPPSLGTPDAGGPPANGAQCATVNWTDDVAPLVQARCLPCHGAPPTYGAPAALVTYADTLLPSREDGTLFEFQAMAARVASGQMPASGPPLSPDEVALVVAWADAGAPQAPCTGTTADVLDAGTNTFDAGLIDTSTANFKGTANGFVDLPDAGAAGNDFQCFSFAVDTAGQQVEAVQFAPIVDNATILHHLVVFRVSTASQLPPQYECFGGPFPAGTSGSASFLYGWAPGIGPWIFPPETGMPLASGEQLVVQIHYHNFTGAPQQDSSGVAMWWTTQRRQYPASVYRLGPTSFLLPAQQPDTQVSQDCTIPAGTAPMHIFGSGLHMHLHGTQIATQVVASGATSTLASTDPWSFNEQRIYPVSQDVKAGDHLVTTCHYDTTGSSQEIPFGETTEDEMCFDFLYVYPVDAGTVPATCK